jgi:hypothetical protein
MLPEPGKFEVCPTVLSEQQVHLADALRRSATAFTNIVGDMNPSSAPSALGNDATVPQFTRSMLARVSRSRQHFGSYRHDLLVGLRLVAVVEREMLQAEWENWVLSESSRCRHIEGMLDKTGGNKTEGLRDWWDRYCGNCMEELKQLGIGS